MLRWEGEMLISAMLKRLLEEAYNFKNTANGFANSLSYLVKIILEETIRSLRKYC